MKNEITKAIKKVINNPSPFIGESGTPEEKEAYLKIYKKHHKKMVAKFQNI